MGMTYSVARRSNVVINEFYDYEKTAAIGSDEWIDTRSAEFVAIETWHEDGTGVSKIDISYRAEKPSSGNGQRTITKAAGSGYSLIDLGGPGSDYVLPCWIRTRISTAAGAGDKVRFHTHVRRMG